VTVEGGSLKQHSAGDSGEDGLADLPDPALPALDEPYGILVTGVGGTGVVTIGALIGMAAHLEGKGVTVLDMTGLAQKGGAVLSHVRIAARPEAISAVRIANGGARLLLGCDLVVSASGESVSKLRPGHSRAIINSHQTMPGDFTRNPDLAFPERELSRAVANAVGQGGAEFLDATGLATGLLGDSLATNLFMLGFAYQCGLVPVSAEAIDRAIELNGAAVEFNRRAFRWGRRAAVDRDLVAARATPAGAVPESHRLSETLDEVIGRRADFLTRYQNAAYAARYAGWVDRVRLAETAAAAPGSTALADAAARALFKLMAYKDEYEVARLYTDGDFLKRVGEQFEGDYTLKFHLAPPLVAERDPKTGHLQKRQYGKWMLGAFRVLARLKGLRGTPFDIFGRTEERRAERQAIADYEAMLGEILAGLTAANHPTAVELAAVPLEIRGFGHVKEANRQRAAAKAESLMTRFRAPPGPHALAAE
jgi:indolepyruvate ferredoxin oxidoreductase